MKVLFTAFLVMFGAAVGLFILAAVMIVKSPDFPTVERIFVGGVTVVATPMFLFIMYAAWKQRSAAIKDVT
jgi:hypothetical protein